MKIFSCERFTRAATRLVIALAILVATPAMADSRIIELTDGSRIRGEVVSMTDGVYTINNEALGIIKLDASRVAAIIGTSTTREPAQQDGVANQGAMAAVGQSAVQSVQSGIASDPGLMRSIMQLQHDPEMQAILSDPELMRAVQSLDFETLSKSPKFQALMNNSRVRGIVSKAK